MTDPEREVEIVRGTGAVIVVQPEARERGRGADGADRGAEPPAPEPADESRHAVTHHVVTIGEQAVAYTARTGTVTLRTEEGKPRARVFFVAYTRDDVGDLAERPITFAFNGGPGSSSVWLHLGLLGPRRVALGTPEDLAPPPWSAVPNPHALLDATDLVFIDPVSTGFSRAAEGVKPEGFHAVGEDVRSVAEFIRLYVTRHARWASPKFLAGESYGTTRAAALAGRLQDAFGMYLNGLVLISCVLDFQTLLFHDGNDLPYVLFLPTYAAAAHYHGRVRGDIAALVAEAEAFALGPYASALLRGRDLPAEERATVRATLARLTGLSEASLDHCDLRPRIHRFCKSLRRDEHLTIGRLDARFTGIDPDAAGDVPAYDPSYAAILGPYSTAFNHLVRSELRFESDLPYEILTARVQPWSYDDNANRFLNVAPTLRDALARNPALRVFVASGLYDLATPHLAVQHTLAHLGPVPRLENRIVLRRYPAGHMMYIDEPSLAALKRDLAAFVAEPAAGPALAG